MDERYLINDIRTFDSFRKKTFSGFKKNDIITAVLKAIESKKVEEIKNDEDMMLKTNEVIEKIQSFTTEQITEDVLSTVLRTQSLVEEIYNGHND